MDLVRQQYERFPYPPIPSFALPLRKQGKLLQYELGIHFLCKYRKQFFGSPLEEEAFTHNGKTILVVGAGTLEPLVVAQMHPQAKKIIALDISKRSLGTLKKKSKTRPSQKSVLHF